MLPQVYRFPLDLYRVFALYDEYASSRYERWIRHLCFTADKIASSKFGNFEKDGLVFRCTDLNAGGAILPALPHPRYGLYFGDENAWGAERATYTRTGTETRAEGMFTGTLGNEADGPWLTRIVGYDAAGVPTVLKPFWVWIDRNGTANDHPDVIFQNGSYDWVHPDADVPVYLHARVPKAKLKTREVPLKWFNLPSVDTPINAVVPHVFPGGEPFNTAVPANQLTRINFLPGPEEDTANEKRPCVTSRGITATENIQPYFSTDWFAETPKQPLLDGPRGVGTLGTPTALWVGHAGSMYGGDTFSTWRVNFKGETKRFSGLRHKRAPYWEDMLAVGVDNAINGPEVEVLGDWDASIPLNRRFPWESWGMVFDLRASAHDPSLPKINVPPFGDLPQHLGEGPVQFLTCRFGRVLKQQFHKSRPGDPPTITEWITGLSDPWGIAHDGGSVLFVTERTRHAISMWSADTPQTFLGDLLVNANGNNFGAMGGQSRRTWQFPASYYLPPNDWYKPNLSRPRSQAIVAPEGCIYQDGFVYWASFAQGQIRRINVATRQVEVCANVLMSYNSQSFYVYITISDGTFGPRGTLFSSTYDNQYFGRPRAYLPVPGVAADGTPLTHSKDWDWAQAAMHIPGGPGGRTSAGGYSTACAVGNGMLVCGSSLPGLEVFTLATLGEAPTDEAKAKRGFYHYRDQGHRLLFGNGGYGFVDEPLPWGENGDQDYWLKLYGHDPDTAPPPDPCAAYVAQRDAALVKIANFKAALA